MERADGLLRIMRTNYILSLDKGINSNLTWRPVLEIFTNLRGEELENLERGQVNKKITAHWRYLNLCYRNPRNFL